MNMYGKTKQLGDMAQLAGIREFEFSAGKGKGARGFEVHNASGLRFTVVGDKCLDIYDLSYKGINFSFLCKNGFVGPKFFNALDNEFLYYWNAGMMATCGLSNIGPACMEDNLYRTMHGRIGMTPAEYISVQSEWEEDDYMLRLSGEMRESFLFGMNLRLKRMISTSLYSKELCIRDTLMNLEPTEEYYAILYHFNFGYPLLDAGTYIVKPKGNVLPRDEEAEPGLGEWDTMPQAIDNAKEQVFFHENPEDKDGYAYAGIVNPALEIGAYIKYAKQNLPVLAQWKNNRSHDYVMGLEPANTYLRGRADERHAGSLKTIAPYGEINFELHLGVLDGKEEIEAFKNKVTSIG